MIFINLKKLFKNIKSNQSWTHQEIQNTRTELLNTYDHLKTFLKENRKIIEVANKSIESGDSYDDILFMKNVSNFVETYTNKFIFKEIHQYFNKFVEPTKELKGVLINKSSLKSIRQIFFIAGEKYKKVFLKFSTHFRNIIDHGIESIEERLSLEKNERALIEITFEKIDKGFEIYIRDDGRGN